MPQQREQGGLKAAAEPAESGRGRLELSMAKVTASALAAVVGAVLASELGVYGTILGAAVVSIGATTGSAIFQHVFKRTGEQLRSVVDRSPAATVNGLRQVPADGPGEISSEWNEPQTVRARRRWTWKTYAAVSGLIFALAMTPILVVELAAGKPLHDITTGRTGSGTSLNPGSRPAPPAPPSDRQSSPGTVDTGPSSALPSRTPSAPASGTGASTSPSATPSDTPSGSPSSGPPAPPTSSQSPATGGGGAVDQPQNAPSGTPTP